MINLKELKLSSQKWKNAKPFPHIVINNFFESDIAKKLEKEFPDYNNAVWDNYNNAIEVKKICNNWKAFPSLTYQVFSYLNSEKFVNKFSNLILNSSDLISDPGLHGGGWHIHSRGGKLNTHLDYSIHPKLKLQRKINLIIYLNSDWQDDWGGRLGFWENGNSKQPGELCKEIEPRFNRAVIFDTTKNSWHGLPESINCPENEYRKSMALYYLIKPSDIADKRAKALFSPSKSQSGNDKVLKLIKKRSEISGAHLVYEEE